MRAVQTNMGPADKRKEIAYADDIRRARETRRQSGLRVWTREDAQAKTFRTTSDSGPRWATVERRITYDRTSGAVIRDEDVKGINAHNTLYAKIPDGPRDITTVLYYLSLIHI